MLKGAKILVFREIGEADWGVEDGFGRLICREWRSAAGTFAGIQMDPGNGAWEVGGWIWNWGFAGRRELLEVRARWQLAEVLGYPT